MFEKVLKVLSMLRRQGTPMRAHTRPPERWDEITFGHSLYILLGSGIFAWARLACVGPIRVDPSGSRLCALIGVPWCLSMLSTLSTFSNVLFQDKSPRAEGAKTDPLPGHAYEGTQPTA